MKKLFSLLFSLFLILQISSAQTNLLNKLKAKAQEKIENAGKGKKAQPEDTAAVGRSNEADNPPAQTDTVPAVAKSGSDITALRKFGFVRGANIIFEDAFQDDDIGDYPKRWQTDAGGEVVSLSGIEGKWLRGTELSTHAADFLKVMPLNFTLEFDVVSDAKNGDDYFVLEINLASSKGGKNFNAARKGYDASGFRVELDFFKPWMSYQNFWGYGGDSTNGSFIDITSPDQVDLSKFNFNGKPLHISLVRQDSRLVMYINTTRMFDVRNAFAKNTELNNLVFTTTVKQDDPAAGLYFSNIILAETVTDNRKDLFVDGKYVTNSILFETNSDKLQPSSLSSITVIADYLKANPQVKLKIAGHTDDVGEDASNLTLSMKRAKSVMNELVDFHKIDASRLSAEGKGETQPVAPNSTREGKSQNRRVEFIKM